MLTCQFSEIAKKSIYIYDFEIITNCMKEIKCTLDIRYISMFLLILILILCTYVLLFAQNLMYVFC